MKLTARELLLKLGEAKGRYRAAWRLMDIQFPEPTTKGIASFSFALNRQKLRIIRRREGRYLLRTTCWGVTQLNCGNFTSTIWSRAYNSESKSFDRPWPFGPESNQQ